MSQLTNRFDSLMQEAKRAVQRVQTKQQQSNQLQQAVYQDEQLISTTAIGCDESNLSSRPVDCIINEQSLHQQDDGFVRQQDVVQQLAAMRQQYELKQQEVEVLQAQIQRLCSFVEAAVASESPGNSHICHEAELKQKTSDLQTQLEQATSELQQCRTQLHVALESAQQLQSILATTSAAKAGLERRAGALKLLLAEQIKETAGLSKGLTQCQAGLDTAYSQLLEAQQQHTMTQAEMTSKDEDLQAMHTALQKMSEQVAVLAGEDLQQLPCSQGHTQQQRLGSSRRNSADNAEQQQLRRDPPPQQLQLQQQVQQQQELIAKQQQDLSSQQQELAATAQRLQDVCSLLALKEDSLAHFKRHANMLQQQLEAAKQQVAATQKLTVRSTISEDLSNSGGFGSAAQPTSLSAAPTSTSMMASSQSAIAGADASGSPETPRACMTAAASLAQADLVNVSPRLGEQLAALSPFAKARGFLAQRDADAMARLKEELHDSQLQVKELKAELVAVNNQLHGLQTAYTAKTAQCNRLDSETRQADRQLKQAQAAAASEQEVVGQQLAALSDRILELEDQLEAAQQREQQTQQEVAAVRNKLAQVLDAVVQETDSLQEHKPQLHTLYSQDMPAVMAELGMNSSGGDLLQPAAMQGSASRTAAALTVLGPATGLDKIPSSSGRLASSGSCTVGDPVNSGTPSKEGGLFGGNKLFGALLGRRNSSGPAEVGTGVGDRVMLRRTSRTSGEWPRAVTSSKSAVYPGMAGYHALSRAGSDTASTEGLCHDGVHGYTANACSKQQGSCCTSRAPTPPQVQGSCAGQLACVFDGAVAQLASLQEADEQPSCGAPGNVPGVTTPAGQVKSGCYAAGSAVPVSQCQSGAQCGADHRDHHHHDGRSESPLKGRMSLPGPVADKLDAFKGLLHKLAPDKDK